MAGMPPSVVFISTPTSGTGSLWRIISAFAAIKGLKPVKQAELFANENRLQELRTWQPAPTGHIYLINTPQIWPLGFDLTKYKIIINFRDPRDLSCNQYHWALQHPVLHKTEEQIAAFREQVRQQGIDVYASGIDNRPLFNPFMDLAPRIVAKDPGVLPLSYAQLCLAFDQMLPRLSKFLDVELTPDLLEAIAPERVTQIASNPDWIGKIWSGADFGPGRYLKELSTESQAKITEKYSKTLGILAEIDLPQFRELYVSKNAPPVDVSKLVSAATDPNRVLIGLNGYLFLQNDTNRNVEQIQGKYPITSADLDIIATAHRDRYLFCVTKLAAPYDHVVIPNKEIVLESLLPSTVKLEEFGPRPITVYLNSPARHISSFYYNPDALKSVSFPTFPKQDSHWTHRGAITYLTSFFKARAPEVAPTLINLPTRAFASTQVGDQGQKIKLPAEGIEIVVPAKAGAQKVFDNDITNEGRVRIFENSAAPHKGTLLIMHDSFGDWLLQMLSELYQRTIWIHSIDFDFNLVEQLKPTRVVTLQIERFFIRKPSNTVDLRKTIAQLEANKGAKDTLENFPFGVPLPVMLAGGRERVRRDPSSGRCVLVSIQNTSSDSLNSDGRMVFGSDTHYFSGYRG